MLTGFLLACKFAVAAPAVKIQTSYYSVSGNDSNSLYQSLQQYGPIGENGKRYHAVTRWQANWNYAWREAANGCQLDKVEVSVDIEYLLPELKDLDTKAQKFRNDWNTYFLALFKHEQQHKDYAIQAATELEKELLAINSLQACFTLKDKMADTAQKVLDKYERKEKEFDRVTDHGLKQGIKLP
ncbi:MAG: DUF922 domain-containing Zn-dependent protease [Thiotrichaceae bacterium]|nr:DUF922 domain-containing Zn-dependent protease [Thiotrichaceae bacterium]